MNDMKLIWTGGTGLLIASLACFTPALVVLLAAVGLSAWLGWADYVLFPAMAICFGILAYGIYRSGRNRGAAAPREE